MMMGHTYSSLLFHCTFSTKDRQDLIDAELQEMLWPYLGGIARKNGLVAMGVGGVENHVHVLLSLPASTCVSKAMQFLKGGSSKWIHDSFPRHSCFEWQQGYGAFSIGISGVERTLLYIANQKEHHRNVDYKQEFVAFLKKHRVKYDEATIWD
jgi:putative transposase